MKFTVPTNWQDDVLDKICKDSVIEIYGKLNSDFVGGGRASCAIPCVSSYKARRHIKSVLQKGLGFNYLLNSVCMENLEFTIRGQRKIRQLLDWLSGIGVTSVTVATPYLLEFIKQNYPNFRLCVSTQAGVNNQQRAEHWENLGADSITVSFVDINRDFAALRRIKESVSCQLQVIANLDCLYGCPFFYYHSCLNSHASQSYHRSKGFLIDYCFLKCNTLKLKNPVEFIRSPWIRPEDIHYYEEVGINTVKLVNRAMTSEALKIVIDAYTAGSYDGNLLDLFSEPFKTLGYQRPDTIKNLKSFFRPFLVNVFKLYKFRNIFTKRLIYIDNKALDGFINHFFESKCTLKNCKECGYCQKVTEAVIEIDESYRRTALSRYETFLSTLVNGDIFRYF